MHQQEPMCVVEKGQNSRAFLGLIPGLAKERDWESTPDLIICLDGNIPLNRFQSTHRKMCS
jgi:hypothetical protein